LWCELRPARDGWELPQSAQTKEGPVVMVVGRAARSSALWTRLQCRLADRRLEKVSAQIRHRKEEVTAGRWDPRRCSTRLVWGFFPAKAPCWRPDGRETEEAAQREQNRDAGMGTGMTTVSAEPLSETSGKKSARGEAMARGQKRKRKEQSKNEKTN
jgi:hypothetical protein